MLLMDQETAGYVNSFASESYSICTSVLQGAKLGRLLFIFMTYRDDIWFSLTNLQINIQEVQVRHLVETILTV